LPVVFAKSARHHRRRCCPLGGGVVIERALSPEAVIFGASAVGEESFETRWAVVVGGGVVEKRFKSLAGAVLRCRVVLV